MRKTAIPKSPTKLKSGNQDKALSTSLKKSNNETNDYSRTNDANKVDESNDLNPTGQEKSKIYKN